MMLTSRSADVVGKVLRRLRPLLLTSFRSLDDLHGIECGHCLSSIGHDLGNGNSLIFRNSDREVMYL